MVSERRPIVVITGGNRGVGEGICYVFAEKGYDIFMTHYKEEEKAKKVAEKVRKEYGAKIVTFDCDQSKPDIGDLTLEAALKSFDQIDVVMCNAGVGLEKYMRLTKPVEIDHVYNVNFRGSLLVGTKFAVYMMEKGIKGTILFTASLRAVNTTPMDAAYGGLKAGLKRATRSLAREFAPYGIRVCTISPGLMSVYAVGYEDDDYEVLKKTVPLHTTGDGFDVGYVAAFLASKEAKFITGIDVFVDGGSHLGEDIWSKEQEWTATHGRGTFIIRD